MVMPSWVRIIWWLSPGRIGAISFATIYISTTRVSFGIIVVFVALTVWVTRMKIVFWIVIEVVLIINLICQRVDIRVSLALHHKVLYLIFITIFKISLSIKIYYFEFPGIFGTIFFFFDFDLLNNLLFRNFFVSNFLQFFISLLLARLLEFLLTDLSYLLFWVFIGVRDLVLNRLSLAHFCQF